MKDKPSQKRDQYTVVLEDLRSHFKAFGESLDFVRADVSVLKKEFREFKDETKSNFETVFEYCSNIDDEIKSLKSERVLTRH